MLPAQNQLIIDNEFSRLKPVLPLSEKRNLMYRILHDISRETICTWNGILVDGLAYYELYNNMHLQFLIREMNFDSRESAIIWICTKQLENTKLIDEFRRYLIGKKYIAERERNEKLECRYEKNRDIPRYISSGIETRTHIARRLGNEYKLARRTIEQYGDYAMAIDILAEFMPDLVSKVLLGKQHISLESTILFSRLPSEIIKATGNSFNGKSVDAISTLISRAVKKNRTVLEAVPSFSTPQTSPIKYMPKYDPDAAISSLILTIPSWISSMDRTEQKMNLSETSVTARNHLIIELTKLSEKVNRMLVILGEGKNGRI